jgi:CRP-like cAMP-binding protein
MNIPAPQQTKKFKKGDLLFQESETIESIFIIQSGKVKTYLQRPKTTIELQQINAPSVLGENLLLTPSGKHTYCCSALSEVTVIEIPAEGLRGLIESSNQIIKFVVKALLEQIKTANSIIKTLKLENDNSPCSDELVSRLFGGIYHFINHTGEVQKDGRIACTWSQMKQYTFRIFNLNQEKVENACNILVKFKMAEFLFEKNEDEPNSPEQLTKIFFTDIKKIESFYDYFQYYFFKSGKQDFLRVDETLFNLVRGILKATELEIPDKQGLIRAPLNTVLEFIKANYNITISATQWTLLDQKGLFTKRQEINSIFIIIFNLEEFQRSYNAWRFIREINKWNQTGNVNPKDPEFPILAKNPTDLKCPQCHSNIQTQQKFCGQCGAKIVENTAA